MSTHDNSLISELQAEEEIKQLSLFEYLVVNKKDGIEQAVSDIKAIIRAEQCRIDFRRIVL